MVFVDANTEDSYKVRPQGLQEALGDFQKHVNFNEVIKLESRHRMTDEEWAAVNAPRSEEDQKKVGQAINEEWVLYKQSCDELREKKQLEKRVMGGEIVSVVSGNNIVDIKDAV